MKFLFFLLIIVLLSLHAKCEVIDTAKYNNYKTIINNYETRLQNNEILSVNDAGNFVRKLIVFAQELNNIGDFYKGEIYLNEAKYYYVYYKLHDNNLKAYLFQNIGYNYLLQQNYNKAIYNYNIAINVIPDSSIVYKSSIYSNIAGMYFEINKFQLAKSYYELSIKVLLEHKISYTTELASVYKGYSIILYKLNEIRESEILLIKAYAIIHKEFGDKNINTVRASNYLGYFYKNTDRPLMSIMYFQKSIIGIQKEFNDTNIYINPKFENLIVNTKLLYALRYKAHAFYQLYLKTNNRKDILASVETFKITIGLIEKARQSYLNDESSLSFSNSYKETLDNAIVSCYVAFNATNDSSYLYTMYNFSEKSKASLLSNSILNFYKNKQNGASEQLLNNELLLKNDISVLKAIIEKQKDANTQKLFKSQLYEKVQSLDSVKQIIKNKTKVILPENNISVSEIQKNITENEAVIQYSLTNKAVFIFAILKNKFIVSESKIDSVFINKIRILRKYLTSTNFEKSYSDIDRFGNTSYFLYKKLIAPVKNIIKNKHLIIIPEEELLYIPFDILISKKYNNETNYRNFKYLICDYPISYNYSATLRFKVSNKCNEDKGGLIAFAPNYNNSSYKLASLPNAITEANYIAELCNGEEFVNSLATETRFKKIANKYKYIHLAMHASIEDENPLFSKLYFNNDSLNDGELFVHELHNIKINSDLVVLNGCNTGTGKLFKGEGLYSLARAFIQSGSSNITLTLWNVHDNASSKIIKSYYKNLTNGISNDVALQKAKIDFIQNSSNLTSLPHFWSPFIIIGDNKLVIEKGYSFLSIIAYVSIILLTILLIFIVYKLKK